MAGFGHSPAKINDNDFCSNSAGWHSQAVTQAQLGGPHWLQVELPKHQAAVTSYGLKSRSCASPSYAPLRTVLKVSIDGVNWAVRDNHTVTQVAWVNRTVNISSTITFARFFRWEFPQDGYVEIYEAYLTGCVKSFSPPVGTYCTQSIHDCMLDLSSSCYIVSQSINMYLHDFTIS